MSFRMIYLLSFLLLIWVILDQLTVVNVRAANFLQQPMRGYPILSEKIESDSYSIETVLLGKYGKIYYEPSKRYYIAATSEGIAKVDDKGEVAFKMLAAEGHSFQNDVEGEHFVLTTKGIINLHDEKPVLHPYNEVRYLSDSMHWQEWEAVCRSNYEQATFVLFDRYYTARDSTHSEEVIHFFIANKWTTLINNEKAGTIYTSGQYKNYYHFFGDEVLLEPKSNPLYVMKDVKKRTFSNSIRETDAQLAQNYERDVPHKGYAYTAQAHLDVKKFKKLQKYNYPETIWLLFPLSWLPQEYYGQAVNSLQVKGEELLLKTEATRGGLGLGRVDNRLYLFDVPAHFGDHESLSFIWNSGGENSASWNNQGFYVIKKK